MAVVYTVKGLPTTRFTNLAEAFGLRSPIDTLVELCVMMRFGRHISRSNTRITTVFPMLVSATRKGGIRPCRA